jgi:hypothetical protein
MNPADPLEFYETPHAFAHYLFRTLPIRGTVLEPCVGSGAIVKAHREYLEQGHRTSNVTWLTNDIDTRWAADRHQDARELLYHERVDWHVSNPPFTPALSIIDRCLAHAQVGVAMHLRASIHEVLKTGDRRTWMARHKPNGILWLPRFAYQRSKTTAAWTTDSVCACWVIWLKDRSEQFIDYAPEWVIDELDAETPAYRRRMDQLTKGGTWTQQQDSLSLTR